MKDKKLLILGGSHRDIPLIKAAQKLGFFVVTFGRGYKYIGHNFSDKAYFHDFNDFPKIYEAVNKEKIEYLVPGCSEQAYINTVALSEKFGFGEFDSLSNTLLLHNKGRFKEFCLNNNIDTPYGIYLKSIDDLKNKDIPIPCVIKPVNSSGGIGVSTVFHKKEFSNAAEKAFYLSKKEGILIEELIEGRLMAYSSLIFDKKVCFSFIAKDDTYLNKYLVNTSYPLKLSLEIESRIKNNVEKICKVLDLKKGPFHLQFILKDDTPYVIDINRRIPGDLFPYLIEFATDFNYSEKVVRAHTVLDSYLCDGNLTKTRIKPIIRHCIRPCSNGIFEEAVFDELANSKKIYEIYLLNKGDLVENYLRSLVGIVFFKFNNFEEMNSFLKDVNDHVKSVVR